MLEMMRDQKTQMHDISHGKRDRLSLSGKYPSVGCRLLERNQSYRLSLDVISPDIVRRLSLDVINHGLGYPKCKIP